MMMKTNPIIFLDVDGVLNCQLYYNSQQFDDYKQRCDESDCVQNRLEGELNSLKNEINVIDDTIAALQNQADEWKD